MKRTISMVFIACLIAGISAYGQSAQDTKTDKSTTATSTTAAAEDAQRVATGQITKIDVKKKTLTVREASLNEPTNSGNSPNANRRGGTGGGGGMGGRRRGGMGTGYPYPGGGGGGRPTSTSRNTGKEFKVIVTDQTAIKDHVTTIGFDLLRIGDRISVQGLPKGKGDDLQATQITVSQ